MHTLCMSALRRHDSHYDIALTKRAQALRAGAIEITRRQAGAMALRQRVLGKLGQSGAALEFHATHSSTAAARAAMV